jgi:hypothetical protein
VPIILTAVPTTLPCNCVVLVERPGDLARCPSGHDTDRPDHLRRR